MRGDFLTAADADLSVGNDARTRREPGNDRVRTVVCNLGHAHRVHCGRGIDGEDRVVIVVGKSGRWDTHAAHRRQGDVGRNPDARTKPAVGIGDQDLDLEIGRARGNLVEYADDATRASNRLAVGADGHVRAGLDRGDLGARAAQHGVYRVDLLQREDLARPGILARIQVAVNDDAADGREDARLRDLHAKLIGLRERDLFVRSGLLEVGGLESRRVERRAIRLHVRLRALDARESLANGLLIVAHRYGLRLVLLFGNVALFDQRLITAQIGLIALQICLRLTQTRLRLVERTDALRNRKLAGIDFLRGAGPVARRRRQIRVQGRLEVSGVEEREQLAAAHPVPLLDVDLIGRLAQRRLHRYVLKGCDEPGELLAGRNRPKGGDDRFDGRRRRWLLLGALGTAGGRDTKDDAAHRHGPNEAHACHHAPLCYRASLIKT